MDVNAGQNGSTRTLLIMRHGQAESFGVRDVARELTERGARDSYAVGTWMRASGYGVDHALVSGATRTRSTWSAVADGGHYALAPDVRLDLYTASPEIALDEIRLIPEEVTCALLVGHNPTVSFLASLLHDGLGEPDVLTRMIQGFPPAAVVALEVPGPWGELAFGDARVTTFRTPAQGAV